MSKTFEKINYFANKYNFTTYLEIGVQTGFTFFQVTVADKTGVDIDFKCQKNNTDNFFEMSSDNFFAQTKNDSKKYDIVLIDGLHTFEQAFRDFVNVISVTHDNSIIILDDTLPCDPYSALPDKKESRFFRSLAALKNYPWHGDVYKMIFAIHEFYPEYSYLTEISDDNPQTIVWKNKTQHKKDNDFNSMKKIKDLSYFDLLRNIQILHPIYEKDIFEEVGKEINPDKLIKDIKNIIKPINI